MLGPLLLAAVGVPACATILGLRDGIVDLDATTPSDAGFERQDIDGGNVDRDANTAVCGDAGVNTTGGRWVTTNGSGSSDCTESQPCNFPRAMTVVQAGEVVRLANGTYPGRTFTSATPANIKLEGGWIFDGTSWTVSCDNTTVTIMTDGTSPPGDSAVRLEGVQGITFSLLTIDNRRPVAAGQGRYGLFVLSSQVTLDNVRIFTESGGDGVAGAPGVGTAFVDCTNPSTGAAGAPGAAGSPPPYTCDSAGCHDTAPGTAGSTGVSGLNGAVPANSGECKDCTVCSPKSDGGCNASVNQQCAGNGTFGCGGGGGNGGTVGSSGGSSIALYVWSSTVSFKGSPSLAAHFGGNGAAGGLGASGADGGVGQTGNNLITTCASTCGPAPSCSSSSGFDAGVTLTGGMAGGAGGAGGKGGQGGGGSGGHSFAYFVGGGGTVLNPPDGGTEIHSAGTGAPAGGVNGQNKVAGP